MKANHTINVRGKLIDLNDPHVMGIMNVTPDSFFKDSRKTTIHDILSAAEQMLIEGATFLDIGGYSSRPGATHIGEAEELDRVLAPIEAIAQEFPEAIISIDTFRSSVAKEGVASGAHLVNDISGGHLDAAMLQTVAELQVPYIAMHMKGTPQTMKAQATYDDVLKEVMHYFSAVLHQSNQLGIADVIIDPGFGFAKTSSQSFQLMKSLDHLHQLGKPLMVGVSRKSMIYKTLTTDPEKALNGTSVINTVALMKGAHILRVHDVKEAVEAIRLIKEVS